MPIPFRSVGDTVLTNQGIPFSTLTCMKSNVPPGVTDIARSFNPFGGTYLADPYPFFSEARAATPVFYHQKTNFWVVTRYNDIRQIFQNTKLFSASNALDTPGVCPAAGKIDVDANFNVVPTLTNTDHPHDTRVRRLANSAFTTKRVADGMPETTYHWESDIIFAWAHHLPGWRPGSFSKNSAGVFPACIWYPGNSSVTNPIPSFGRRFLCSPIGTLDPRFSDSFSSFYS